MLKHITKHCDSKKNREVSLLNCLSVKIESPTTEIRAITIRLSKLLIINVN